MSNSIDIYNEIDTSSATPHRLIQLLLENCLHQIHVAEQSIANKDMNKRHRSVSKAMSIIVHLRECLNMNDTNTQEMSKLLDQCYETISKNLIYATLYNDADYLKIAYTSLLTIKSGWDGIA